MKGNKFADVEIVRLRNIRKPIGHVDLLTEPMIIGNRSVISKPQPLFNGRVLMLLPEYFIEVPKEIAKLRYLSEDRPQVIYADRIFSVDIGLSLVDRDGRDLSTTVSNMREAVRITTPQSVLYERGEVAIDCLEGHWLEYKSFALDDEVYNLLFLIGSAESLLLGAFHCPMPYYGEWKAYILRALEYSEINDRSESKEEEV